MRDYSAFCEMFYAAHYLPIAMYGSGGFVCSAGFGESSDPYAFVLPKLLSMDSPAIYVSSDMGYYGLVRGGDGEHYFAVGPAYSTPVTETVIRAYVNKNAIPHERHAEAASFLGGIPQYTYNQFINMLLYLHYSLTGEKLDITQAFGITDAEYQVVIGQRHSEKMFNAREDGIQHGTYNFERQMLELIKSGSVDQLEEFLLGAAHTMNIKEGKLASTPLRQAKNLFIGLVTMVGKNAAIPGGMDVEQAYQLMDVYIQECEKLQTVEAVKNLQYNMPIDFAKRVAQQKLPSGVSKEIYSCTQFIIAHINDPIGVADVVAHSGRSRAYLFKKFSREMGISIGAYITQCRLREAKSLLRYTDKPIAEISNYLCFSSQSHFQNVFKNHCNITPLEYRKSSQKSMTSREF